MLGELEGIIMVSDVPTHTTQNNRNEKENCLVLYIPRSRPQERKRVW